VLIAFASAYALWKAGVWAGGDVKLFTGLAALNPVNYAVLAGFFGGSALFVPFGYNLPVFPVTLFIFSVFSMFPYAVILTVSKLSSRPDLRQRLFRDAGGTLPKVAVFSLFTVSLGNILNATALPAELYLPVVLLILLFVSLTNISTNRVFAGLSVVLFAFALYADSARHLPEFVQLFFSLFLIYMLFRLASYTKLAMRKNVKIDRLEEGMIVAELLVERRKRLHREQPLSIGTILNYIKNNKLEKLKEASRQDSRKPAECSRDNRREPCKDEGACAVVGNKQRYNNGKRTVRARGSHGLPCPSGGW
jgi:preflagellin peptidase FlaK